ncbi:cation transporter [Thalassospiraceae bacterium LMO-JJ14]|nr:cation transporter [Thalassospiraceae bacterium LMO-JJ14]
MSAVCHHHHAPDPDNNVTPGQRRALWAALLINAAMFVTEITGGALVGSVGLQADAVDFFGDAVNYGLSILVLGMAGVWGTRVAFVKGLAMIGFGIWVAVNIVHHLIAGTVPSAPVMGTIAFIAMLANIACALILFRYRGKDANMASVWICTRNDALSNVAVMLAASGVWVSASGVPDLIVGGLIGGLAIFGGLQVLRLVRIERRQTRRDTEDPAACLNPAETGDD